MLVGLVGAAVLAACITAACCASHRAQAASNGPDSLGDVVSLTHGSRGGAAASKSVLVVPTEALAPPEYAQLIIQAPVRPRPSDQPLQLHFRKFCPNCGLRSEGAGKFCSGCGHDLR